MNPFRLKQQKTLAPSTPSAPRIKRNLPIALCPSSLYGDRINDTLAIHGAPAFAALAKRRTCDILGIRLTLVVDCQFQATHFGKEPAIDA